MTFQIEHRLPSLEEFITLRAQTEWGVPDRMTTETVLQHSYSGVVAVEGGKVIGMARTVGDGCLVLYIQDVVVCKSQRSQGLGKALIQALLDEAAKTSLPNCTVGLFAAVGQNGFYEKLGFKERPSPAYGPGMHGVLSDLMHLTSSQTATTTKNEQIDPISDSELTGIALAKPHSAA